MATNFYKKVDTNEGTTYFKYWRGIDTVMDYFELQFNDNQFISTTQKPETNYTERDVADFSDTISESTFMEECGTQIAVYVADTEFGRRIVIKPPTS